MTTIGQIATHPGENPDAGNISEIKITPEPQDADQFPSEKSSQGNVLISDRESTSHIGKSTKKATDYCHTSGSIFTPNRVTHTFSSGDEGNLCVVAEGSSTNLFETAAIEPDACIISGSNFNPEPQPSALLNHIFSTEVSAGENVFFKVEGNLYHFYKNTGIEPNACEISASNYEEENTDARNNSEISITSKPDNESHIPSEDSLQGSTLIKSGKNSQPFFKKPKQCKKLTASSKCFTCHVCDKQYFRKSKFDLHLRNHTGERPHVCEICKKAFFWKPSLTRHLLRHTGEKQHICNICKKAFVQKCSLTKHLIQHAGERRFVCEFCKKAFTWKSNLMSHLKLEHTGERRHVCGICQKAFKRKYVLTAHMLIHSNERPHACTYCEKAFSSKKGLRSHLGMHTGESPYVCQLCKRAFARKHSLKLHLLTHNMEKTFICHLCNGTFNRKSVLSKHLAHSHWHTGEKPSDRGNDSEIPNPQPLSHLTHTYPADEDLQNNISINTEENSHHISKNTDHDLTLEPEQHVCNFCQKVFMKKEQLSEHFLSSHRIAHFFPTKNCLKEHVPEENSHDSEKEDKEIAQKNSQRTRITQLKTYKRKSKTIHKPLSQTTPKPQLQTTDKPLSKPHPKLQLQTTPKSQLQTTGKLQFQTTRKPKSQITFSNFLNLQLQKTVNPLSQTPASTLEKAERETENVSTSQNLQGTVVKGQKFVKCGRKLYLVAYI